MTTYSQIIDKVATRLRDTSSGTASIIEDYLKEILADLIIDVEFPELLATIETNAGASDTVEFSSVASSLKTYNIIDIRDPNGRGQTIPIIPANILDAVKADQSSTSGYPQYAVVKDETKLRVWPYGSTTPWKVLYRQVTHDYSAASQTIPLSKRAEKVIEDGVLAEMLAYKDDNRASSVYQVKYLSGKNALKRQYQNDYEEIRMQPGSVGNVDNDWERIFGD